MCKGGVLGILLLFELMRKGVPVDKHLNLKENTSLMSSVSKGFSGKSFMKMASPPLSLFPVVTHRSVCLSTIMKICQAFKTNYTQDVKSCHTSCPLNSTEAHTAHFHGVFFLIAFQYMVRFLNSDSACNNDF